MRTIIFTSKNHIFANKAIKELFLEKESNIICIVESTILYPGKNTLKALYFFISKSGLSYTLFQISKFLFFSIGKNIYSFFHFKKESSIFCPYQVIARRKNIPIVSSGDINSPLFVKYLRGKKPDIFVSLFVNQIFRPKLLSIATLGTINMHPSFLPSYRGLSPTVWVLAHNKKTTGVTIHKITDEKVDAGIILAQKKIAIKKTDTEYHLYWRCVLEGIPLLKKILEKIKKGEKLKGKRNNSTKQSYYSYPTKEAIKNFKKNGRKLIEFMEFFYTDQDFIK